MVAILQAVSTGGGSGGSANARNNRGEANSLPAGATATLTSFVASDYQLRGFVVFGTTDLLAWVEVDGTPLDGIIARGTITKVAQVILPNPETYSSALAVVALRVRNEHPTLSGDFEGTLLGE